MEAPAALVVGATGAAACRLVELLSCELGWTVYGVSRHPPAEACCFKHVHADLTDADDCRRAFAPLTDVTHVYYSARAAHGEAGVESIAENLAMLGNVLDAIEPVAAGLRHVHLVEGGKWYGLHIGPYRTPAREDQPRHMPPNFYYDQQDSLEARQRGKRWTWSASRPNVVCDFAPGRARNIVSILGAYAALCRALGVPMDFPGTPAAFESLTEVTDARLLARALAWMGTAPQASNRAFNITNGDLFRWKYLWPVIAGEFGVTCGEPRPLKLSAWMADKQEAWRALADREGLARRDLDEVANWAFADFVFSQDFDVISDLGRLRRAGFCDSVDSEAMFLAYFRAYREARILP